MPCWRSARRDPSLDSDPEVESWKGIVDLTFGRGEGAHAVVNVGRVHSKMVRAAEGPHYGSWMDRDQVRLVSQSRSRPPYQPAHHILALNALS